ncbi:MAG: hypothetical protein IIA88_05220 [Bacteroidetes bacterium]|nr:hypothetical protein [Bacteroidota bacterium]
MKLKLLLLTIINISITSHCFTQTYKQTLSYAQNQYELKNFDEAINTCQRIIFFAKVETRHASSLLAPAYFNLADSYLQIHDYENALACFDSVSAHSQTNDSMYQEVFFKKIACYILQNDYQYALLRLLDINDSLSGYFYRKKLFYLAVVNFKTGALDSSERYLVQLTERSDSAKIVKIFSEINKANKIRPGVAKNLSMLLPGAGQIYYGDIKNGINSFVLNGLLVAAGVYFAFEYTVLDAILFTGPFFRRYYKGGYMKAMIGAERKSTSLKNKKFIELLELVE